MVKLLYGFIVKSKKFRGLFAYDCKILTYAKTRRRKVLTDSKYFT